MGLDASVYCECYETGKLSKKPLAIFDIYVAEDGSLECRNIDLVTQIKFDAWRQNDACQHQGMTIIHHRIGNIALVGLLRAELSKQSDAFPTILKKIIYNGVHCGDFLSKDDILNLQSELTILRTYRCENEETQSLVDNFERQFTELAKYAVDTNKPIVF